MKRNAITKLAATLLATVFVVAACTKAGSTTPDPTTAPPATQPGQTQAPATEAPTHAVVDAADPMYGLTNAMARFPMLMPNANPPIQGGIMSVGFASAGGFTGLLNPVLWTTSDDGEILGYINPRLISSNPSLMDSQQGAATIHFDTENLTVTVEMQEEVYWADGVRLTLHDVVFAFEVIAHPDYTGVRYTSSQSPNIVGIQEYRDNVGPYPDGSVTIPGIVINEEGTHMVIHFTTMNPGFLYAGVWMTPLARHHFAGIPVATMQDHPNSRTNLLGYGAFMIENMVAGESVHLVRNPNFWMGAPLLDGIVLEWMGTELAATAMEQGHFDLLAWTAAWYADFPNPSNFTYLSNLASSLGFTSFRHGIHVDGRSVMDESRIVADVNLRRAIGHAIDDVTIAREIFNGLSFPATSVVSPFHAPFKDWDMIGFSLFDVDRANQILDDAGYVRGADGYRMDLDGNEMTLTWAIHMNITNPIIAPLMMQNWSDIGIRTELFMGILGDFQAWLDFMEFDTDNGEIDLFEHAFGLGFNPNPANLWGPTVGFNRSRYTSPTVDAIIADISSLAAFDNEFVVQRFHDWQHYFYENVPGIPRRDGVTLIAVNNRVTNYSRERLDGIRNVSIGATHLWALTRAVPYTN